MEEAEALCGRIGIMAGGALRCLGSTAHLKERFGNGYLIDVTMRPGFEEAVAEFMGAAVPSARLLLDAGGGRRTYQFTLGGGAARLSSVFESMAGRSAADGIRDWALRQTSLQEVFLRICAEYEA
jgi:hypothetical protein